MLREYEFTVISRGDLSEADHGKLLDDYEQYMLKDGGQILKKDDWGTKRLAYPIKKAFRGHYTIYDFVGLPVHLAEIERRMRIDDNILRYLSIKIGEDIDVDARLAELAKQAADAAARREERV